MDHVTSVRGKVMSQQSPRTTRRVVGGLRATNTPTGPVPTIFPVTAKQAAAVRDSLTERHRAAQAAISAGHSDAEVLADQMQAALREVERYVDHGGGLSDGLVELLAELDIVLVPIHPAARTA